MRSSLKSAVFLAFSPWLLGFPLWLEAPRRSNPHDPRSDLFAPVLPPPATATAPSATSTPSPSPTPTPTPPPGTATFSPTQTSSPTSRPSDTPTPGLKFYDGETAGARLAEGTLLYAVPATAQIGVSEESAVGGAQSTANYLRLTINAAANSWYAEAVFQQAAAVDVSALNALRLHLRVPASALSGCNAFRPAIGLTFSGAPYPNDRSLAVTATAYVDAPSLGLKADTWTQVTIPLSAFLGPNPAGGTITAAAFSSVLGVKIMAHPYTMFRQLAADPDNGSASGEIHLDEVSFIDSPAINTGPYARLYEDFEVPGRHAWGGNGWLLDKDVCGPITFSAPAVDAPGNSLSSCHAGHIQGSQPCGWSTLIGDFWPTYGQAFDLSTNQLVRDLPAGGARGLAFSFKVGANKSQAYHLELRRTSCDAPWNHFFISIQEDDYAPGVWNRVAIDFPADGTSGETVVHQGWTLTELWWGQWDIGAGPSQWKPWGRTDLYRFQVNPVIAGLPPSGDFDFWIDDLEFY